VGRTELEEKIIIQMTGVQEGRKSRILKKEEKEGKDQNGKGYTPLTSRGPVVTSLGKGPYKEEVREGEHGK